MDNTIWAAVIGAIASIFAAILTIYFTRSSRKKNEQAAAAVAASPGLEYRLSHDLEEALALAEVHSRRDGKPVTSTRYVFAAIRRLNPEALSQILKELEERDALPEPLPELEAKAFKLTSDRPFSSCVSKSLNSLNQAASREKIIGVEDLFFDVAKFGKGTSVARMREKGVDADGIEELFSRNRVRVGVRRHEGTEA